MLGRTIAPAASSPSGSITSFSQDAISQQLFNVDAAVYSMDSTGYVYTPTACASAQCDLLVVLHGCQQGYAAVGGALIHQANLNEYADTNQFIVLYPQVVADIFLSNPEGCWDWWGYTVRQQTTHTSHTQHSLHTQRYRAR